MTTLATPEEILDRLIKSLSFVVDECYKHSKDSKNIAGTGEIAKIIDKINSSFWSGMGNTLDNIVSEAKTQQQQFLLSLTDSSQQQET